MTKKMIAEADKAPLINASLKNSVKNVKIH